MLLTPQISTEVLTGMRQAGTVSPPVSPRQVRASPPALPAPPPVAAPPPVVMAKGGGSARSPPVVMAKGQPAPVVQKAAVVHKAPSPRSSIASSFDVPVVHSSSPRSKPASPKSAVVSPRSRSGSHTVGIDVDGDGKTDFLVTRGPTVVRYDDIPKSPTRSTHASPHVSPRSTSNVVTSRSSTVGVDVDGDGKADYYVRGSDRDGDGIPDALQGSRTVYSSSSPRATVGVDVDGDGKADYHVTGSDRDGDGIPDSLQQRVHRAMESSRSFSTTTRPSTFGGDDELKVPSTLLLDLPLTERAWFR